MKVVRQWQDQTCKDGFPNVFEMDDDTYVFTSEKVGVHRDEGGDILSDVYKSAFEDVLQDALDSIGSEVVVEPFDDDMRDLWKRCIDTSMGY